MSRQDLGVDERLKPVGSLETEVFEGIKSVVREHLDLADPLVLERKAEELDELRIVEDLQLDSIELLTLAVEVENHFQVVLDEFGEAEEADIEIEEDAEEERQVGSNSSIAVPSIVTLGDLVALICEKLGAKRGVSKESIETGEIAGPAGPASR